MSGLLTNSEEIQPCGLHSALSSSTSSSTDSLSLFEVKAGSMTCVPSCFLFNFFPCQHITHKTPNVTAPGDNIEIKTLISLQNFVMINWGGGEGKAPRFMKLGSWWSCVVSFTHRPHYLQENRSWYQLHMGLGGVWAHLHYQTRNIFKHCTSVLPSFPLDMDHPVAKPLHPSMHDHSWISPDVFPSFYVTCFLTHLSSYLKHSFLILQACPYHHITSSIYVPSKVFSSFNSLILSSHSHSSGCSFSSQLLVVRWSTLVHIHMSAPHNHMGTYKAYGSLARYTCVNQPLYFEVQRSTCRGDMQQTSQETATQILLLG